MNRKLSDACENRNWLDKTTNFIFGGKIPLPLKTRRSPNATLHESLRLYIKTSLPCETDTGYILIKQYYKASYLKCLTNDLWICMWDGPFDAGNSRTFSFRRILIYFVSLLFLYFLFFWFGIHWHLSFFFNTNPSKRDCGW